MIWTVYGLVSPITRHVIYVGCTRQGAAKRLVNHELDPSSAAYDACRFLRNSGNRAETCTFGEFEDLEQARIVEGRLILAIPGLLNKTNNCLPISGTYPHWRDLRTEIPYLSPFLERPA